MADTFLPGETVMREPGGMSRGDSPGRLHVLDAEMQLVFEQLRAVGAPVSGAEGILPGAGREVDRPLRPGDVQEDHRAELADRPEGHRPPGKGGLERPPLTRARGGPSVRVGQAIPLLGAAAFNGAAAGRLTSTH